MRLSRFHSIIWVSRVYRSDTRLHQSVLDETPAAIRCVDFENIKPNKIILIEIDIMESLIIRLLERHACLEFRSKYS